MPGRLIMEQNGADGAGGVLNGKHHAPDLKGIYTNGDTKYDGSNDSRYYPTPNGGGSGPHSAALLEPPPEIPHITENYQHLGKLIARVAQECFNDLHDVIEKLSEIPLQPMANGVGHGAVNGVGNASHTNVLKKTMLMDFANRQREKFIKLLVLSQWSQQAKDISQLIDLNAWCATQLQHFNECMDRLGQLKIDLHTFKLPGPDIKTALEVLSTGTASWMPSLNYTPPPPLTPQKMLKTLKELNVLLHLRLNLYEDLPICLRTAYTIASGRATFSLPGEFELDVSIFDESPDAQFFFIDLRFLFSPAPELSDGPLREVIEGRVNGILATKGLHGACDFLHDFALTHKVAELRSQAQALAEREYAGAISVHDVHRELVVQYWTNSPRGLSWIEIGVSSGKSSDPRRRAEQEKEKEITSHVHIRWTRDGQETPHKVPVDLVDLDMERIIKSFCSAHSHTLLDEMNQSIGGHVGEKSAITGALKSSEYEPQDNQLRLQFGSYPPVAVFLEPFTGRIAMSPGSSVVARLVKDLNANKTNWKEAHLRLPRALCFLAQQGLERQAERVGWKTVRNLGLTPEKSKNAFGDYYTCFFRFPDTPDANWLIGDTVSPQGVEWRAVKLANRDGVLSPETYHPLPLSGMFQDFDPSRPADQDALQTVKLCSARWILYHQLTQDLHQSGVKCALRFMPVCEPVPGNPTPPDTIPVIAFGASTLLGSPTKPPSPSIADMLMLTFAGQDMEVGSIKVAVRGALPSPDKLGALLEIHDSALALDPKGAFQITLRTPFGTSPLAPLVQHIQSLLRLRLLVDVLKQHDLEPTSLSLTHLTFTYSTSLTATLHLPPSGPISLSLPPSNPHSRIRHLLSCYLNEPDGGPRFARALLVSLPLVRALDKISTRRLAPEIHVRSIDVYRIIYPALAFGVSIQARRSRDDVSWVIAESPGARGERGAFGRALEGHFRDVGEGWRGVDSVVLATERGVERAVVDLDRLVSRFSGDEVKGEEVGREVITLD
ncbi:MED14-domain-containing protein [Trichodelitschia bisporula]|uniref:Mediator of RNA polymerase II transcription subunit 14 n=1 Tax=Trichodelitschia bisporula TaxID=703511 RepID=A0A6G1HVR2_9PEZI|nr:MED14-domain-containing protein [Trichodelitschia bisporula]